MRTLFGGFSFLAKCSNVRHLLLPIANPKAKQRWVLASPYWSGHFQISLVSFGVSLYVATEAKSNIIFHQISRSTGERVQRRRCPLLPASFLATSLSIGIGATLSP